MGGHNLSLLLWDRLMYTCTDNMVILPYIHVVHISLWLPPVLHDLWVYVLYKSLCVCSPCHSCVNKVLVVDHLSVHLQSWYNIYMQVKSYIFKVESLELLGRRGQKFVPLHYLLQINNWQWLDRTKMAAIYIPNIKNKHRIFNWCEGICLYITSSIYLVG